jgi:hypothetical protein
VASSKGGRAHAASQRVAPEAGSLKRLKINTN